MLLRMRVKISSLREFIIVAFLQHPTQAFISKMRGKVNYKRSYSSFNNEVHNPSQMGYIPCKTKQQADSDGIHFPYIQECLQFRGGLFYVC